MNAVQLLTLAAAFYSAGRVSAAQHVWRLSPLVGAFAELHSPHHGVPVVLLYGGCLLAVLLYALTIVWWGRLPASLDPVLPDGRVNPIYTEAMCTHWVRAAMVYAFAIQQAWVLWLSVR